MLQFDQDHHRYLPEDGRKLKTYILENKNIIREKEDDNALTSRSTNSILRFVFSSDLLLEQQETKLGIWHFSSTEESLLRTKTTLVSDAPAEFLAKIPPQLVACTHGEKIILDSIFTSSSSFLRFTVGGGVTTPFSSDTSRSLLLPLTLTSPAAIDLLRHLLLETSF